MRKWKTLVLFLKILLVTTNVVRLYPSKPHLAGLAALRDAWDNKEVKKIPTEDLVKMAEFVLKNNYFEFNGSTKQQLSGTDADDSLESKGREGTCFYSILSFPPAHEH